MLTVAKPTRTVQRFIDRPSARCSAAVLLALSAAVGVGVTLWMVWNVRRLRDYALSVKARRQRTRHPTRPQPPQVPGEDLGHAMDACACGWKSATTSRLCVRALTHELKARVLPFAARELLPG